MTTTTAHSTLNGFLATATPGDTYVDTGSRSMTTYIFASRDDKAPGTVREAALGGEVITVTTTHRGSPDYAYTSTVSAYPIHATDYSIRHSIRVGGASVRLRYSAAKRFSAKKLAELHAAAMGAYETHRDSGALATEGIPHV